jgi:hypothetical protein
MMIKKEFTLHIELTPKELAYEFLRLGAEGRALFFNEVAIDVEEGNIPFKVRMEATAKHYTLTVAGLQVMIDIGQIL